MGSEHDIEKRGPSPLDKQERSKPTANSRSKVEKEETAKLAQRVRQQVAADRASGKTAKAAISVRAKKNSVEENGAIGLGLRKVSAGMENEIKGYTRKGRSLRKDFERPRPDLPADAIANRNRKPITATLPPELIDQINARCSALGIDRTAFVEAAIRRALAPS